MLPASAVQLRADGGGFRYGEADHPGPWPSGASGHRAGDEAGVSHNGSMRNGEGHEGLGMCR
eukprot:5360598-Alexandrium_andersonii.AAC.1